MESVGGGSIIRVSPGVDADEFAAGTPAAGANRGSCGAEGGFESPVAARALLRFIEWTRPRRRNICCVKRFLPTLTLLLAACGSSQQAEPSRPVGAEPISRMNPRLQKTWHLIVQDSPDSEDSAPDTRWMRLDAQFTGREQVCVEERSFAHGISTFAHTVIDIDLHGDYSRFIADAGLAPQASPRNFMETELVFVVRGDGKELWKSPPMRWGSGPARVDVDVTGVGILTLETENEACLDSLSFGAWGEPVVVRR